jgi:hypothetical protein
VPKGTAGERAELLVAAGYWAIPDGATHVKTDAPAGTALHVKDVVRGPFSIVAKHGRRVWLVAEKLLGLRRAKEDARAYALAHGGKRLVVYILDGRVKAIGAVTPNPGHYIPLSPNQKVCASKYISEEVATGKYPRAQAVAIGLSRARAGC